MESDKCYGKEKIKQDKKTRSAELVASNNIKYDRVDFIVKMTFEQRLERSVGLQISDKELSKLWVQVE